MKKWTALALALVMLLSVTACSLDLGNKTEGKPAEDQPPSGVQSEEPSIPAPAPAEPGQSGTVSDEPAPLLPDPDKTDDGEAGAGETGGAAEITASHADVTLFSAGETFTMSARGVEGVYASTFVSADPAVAAVDELTGVVTAVAPGTTKVTMHVECGAGQFDFDCIIRCRWTEEEPSLPVSGTAAAAPSLNDFFATLQGGYEGLRAMMPMEGELLDNYYPGLSGIDAVEESLIQETMISVANVAVGLVRLKDGASADDVAAVKSVLQARIDAQAAGGAFYPDSCETWGQGIVVSAANYVGLFVYPGAAQDLANLLTQTYGG